MINDSVLQYIQTVKQSGEIAQKIQESKLEAAILFIDLCDSTQLKTMTNDEDWFAYIYTFIEFIEDKCVSSEGEVVKQIGDEILLTFAKTSSCENFIEQLANSSDFNSKYAYKIAIDYGLIYKFDFSRIKGDPYGEIVDRCSRIAKLCERNTILCSKDYFDNVQNECYTKTINIQLKGIKATTLIYYRPLHQIDNADIYYQSILNALNNKQLTSEGYKYEPRLFNQSDLYQIKSDIGLPFLVHYLLNVPTCPYTPMEIIENCSNESKRDIFNYIGYILTISSYFISYDISRSLWASSDYIKLFSSHEVNNKRYYFHHSLHINYHEIIKSIHMEARITIKAIITEITPSHISFDYCEILKVENN